MNQSTFFKILGLTAVFGIGIMAFSLRPTTTITADTRMVSYISAGVTRTVSLRKVLSDAFLGARFISGRADAPNTIVEFSDYQCPACATFATQIEPDFKTRLLETGKVRFAYRDFPLPQHQNAKLASVAAACANLQNRFEPMKTILFRAQREWSELSPNLMLEKTLELASYSGINQSAFKTCLSSNQFDRAIAADQAAGNAVQLEATPSFVVNGYLVSGALPVEAFEAIMQETKKP
jgi:protein-disulfide isomerase